MSAMLQKRSLRGLVAALWLCAGLIAIIHAALQYITPGAGGPLLGMQSLAARRACLASREAADATPTTVLHSQGSSGQEAGNQNVHSMSGPGSFVGGIGAMALAGAIAFAGGTAPAKALAEGEKPVLSQWGASIREGFTREQEEKNMGALRTNQSLLPLYHNAEILNSSPQNAIQAMTPFVAMGAASYYYKGKEQQNQP